MMTMNQLENKLRRADRKQAVLYLFCNFVSLLLITAYSAMMFSPTVLLVLPEGGDSRKQMVAIFVLALFGCVVFTVYASVLPQEIQTTRCAHGARRLQKAACTRIIPGSRPAQRRLLAAWHHSRSSLRVSIVGRFSPVHRGQQGNAAAAGS